VKRIRPIALGPFDYDTENLTNMLWVSEGLSVYYQDLVLVRAGIQTRDQYLDKMTASINSFENAPGHHYQLLAAKKPGDKTRLKISRNNVPQEVEVTLDKNLKKIFRIQPATSPSALQGVILREWLRAAQ
jgi:predicted metalloprotease with PDZ domain